MDHEALRPIYYPTLAGGMRRLAPPRTLGPQTPPHFFRNMLNLVPHNGVLRRREGLIADTLGGLLTQAIDLNSTVNGQYPVAIFDFTLWPRTSGSRLLVVTDKELWIVTSTTAYNITPIYTTGTVGVTNGSTAITGGGGQLWRTNNVGDDVLILIDTDAVWKLLDVVSGEDAGTLNTNFTGTTGARTYTIRRSFYGLKDQSAQWAWYGAHARIILDDIYVAGMFGRYWDGAAYQVTGAVLKIAGGADPTKTTFTPADTTYILSSADMDGAGSMGDLDRFFAPLGLEVGENAQLIMPAHIGVDGSADPANSATVYWSSFDDYTEWTLSPGGEAPQIQIRTKMTAIGPVGRSFAVHFDDQVLLASPTGAADPPLSYLRTRAQIGAAGPRLRISVPPGGQCPGGDFFLALDGHTYVFNGDSATPIDTGWDQVLEAYNLRPYVLRQLHLGFLGFDSYRREVSFFFPDTQTTDTPYTKATFELRWNIDTGAMTRQRYAIPLSAMANANYVNFVSGEPLLGKRSKVVGGTTRGNSLDGALLYQLDALTLVDGEVALVSGENPGSMWFELDDQDFGLQHHYSKITAILVGVYGRAGVTETLKCRLSSDEGTNFVTISKSVVLVSDIEQVVLFDFTESAPAASKWKVRIESNDTDTFSFALRSIEVFGVPASDVRAV